MRKSFIISALMIVFAISMCAQNNSLPLPKFYFKVKVDNLEFQFQEVGGLSTDAKSVEYKSGNSKVFSTVKMPGITKVGNVTLKKGIIPVSKKVTDFLDQVMKGTSKKGQVTIELLDEQGKVTMTWILKNAWFLKFKNSDLKNSGKEMTIESIEIVHEGMTIK